MKDIMSIPTKDPILTKIILQILEHANPRQIVLFGSRARGDFIEKSDYDISVLGISEKEYANLLVAIDENDYTLKKIDLLRHENLNDDYIQNINKEGITLYEQG